MTQVMKKIPAVLLAGFIATLVAFAIGALAAQEAYADELDEGTLYVGGQDIVKADDQTVAGGQGTAKLSYDDNGNPVLTLHDYQYTGEGITLEDDPCAVGYSGTAPLTIRLEGTNEIINNAVLTAEIYGIYSSKKRAEVTITGEGKLKAEASQSGSSLPYGNIGFSVAGTLIIESGDITAISGDVAEPSDYPNEVFSEGIEADHLIVREGIVRASGGTATANEGSQCISSSYGICTRSVTVTGGEVYATANETKEGSNTINQYSFGIGTWSPSGSVSVQIGAEVKQVNISGKTKAIQGTVTHEVPGTGWTDYKGTTGQTDLTSGEDISSFKKVFFAPVHKHKDVDGNEITFQPWGSTVGLPYAAGNYYLTDDVLSGGCWVVEKNSTINLCLNGHSITCRHSESAIFIRDNASLSLYDCGTDGMIKRESGKTGMGVNNIGGTFNMYGGTITGNRVTDADGDGGGVRTRSIKPFKGTFNMYGGTITGNSVTDGDGGGVYIHNGAFNMYGGTITGNTASGKGGGIFVNSDSTFQLSGSIKIIDNTVNNKDNNIYLPTGTKAAITGNLTTPEGTSEPQIGISMSNPGVFTSGLSGKLPEGKIASDLFFSDDQTYGVKGTDGGEAWLVEAATINTPPKANNRVYDHSWQPLLIDNTCDYSEEKGTLNYAVEDKDGKIGDYQEAIPEKRDIGKYNVWVKVVGDSDHADSRPVCVTSMVYFPVTFKVANGAWSDETGGTDDRTVDVSRYDDQDLALILKAEDIPAVGENPASGCRKAGSWDTDPADYVNDKTITEAKTFTYTYKKKTTPDIATLPTASAITYGQTLKDSSLSGGEAKASGAVVDGTFTWDKPNTAPSVSDSDKTEYDVTFTPSDTANYESATAKVTVTVNTAATTVTIVPTASAITYGQTLNDSSLSGGEAKASDTVVPGTFKWDSPGTAPSASDSNKTAYDVTFTPSDSVNYKPAACTTTLTVNKEDITPSVSIEGWVYGSAANTPAVEGNLGNGDVTFLYKRVDDSDSKFSDKVPTDAGSYTVKAEVAETENYNAGEATLDFTISPAEMQVTSSGFNGDFDSGAHSITVNAPEGSDIEYSQDGGKTYSTANPAYTDAGEHPVPFRVLLENYNEYAGTETVVIHQAPNSVTVSIEGWTYGEAPHLPTVTAKFGAETAKLAYSDKPDGTYSAGGPDQAGTWYVKATVPETQDYAGAESAPVAFEIAKAAITITADDKSSKYAETLQEPTCQISGAYLADDDLGITLSTDAKKDKPGEYAIKVSWNGNPNYEATLVDGTYTVGKKPAPKPDPKPQPKPQPKPHVNKAVARTQINAGLKAISSGDKVTASWGKVKGAKSYVVYAAYCNQKKFSKVKTVSGKITAINITKIAGKKFNPKKNLKFYVVAYQTVKGKKVRVARSIMAHAPGSKNSKRTNVTGVTVKKASFTLKKGQTRKIKANLVLQKKSKKPLKHEAKFRYATSNVKVAKVNKKGQITAVGKGKCTVYVYAVSGVSKKIKVIVK